MIGTQKSQLSLLDGAFNARTKRSRTDELLEKINKLLPGTRLKRCARACIKTLEGEGRHFR